MGVPKKLDSYFTSLLVDFTGPYSTWKLAVMCDKQTSPCTEAAKEEDFDQDFNMHAITGACNANANESRANFQILCISHSLFLLQLSRFFYLE